MREGVAKRGMTRREFLKSMLVGEEALYLALPNVSLFGRLKIHPEYKILTLGLRDVVTAQKMQSLLQNENDKPLLASRGGSRLE